MSNPDQAAIEASPRLSKLQAAWVIARRDFIAVLFSRAFLFFLLGPLFPILVGGLAGSIGKQVTVQAISVEVGVAMNAEDNAAMIEAGDALRPQLGGAIPKLSRIVEAETDTGFDARAFLDARRGNYAVIVTGTPAAPEIVGTEGQVKRWKGPVELIAATASGAAPSSYPESSSALVASSAASERSNRVRTAQAAQMLLFLLSMLLAGMVLSNLAEEKGNKIIEILAAAIPMDSVFMGKLFAMLGVSFVGIFVWGAFGWGFWAVAEDGIVTITQTDFRNLPGPAVGWPIFLALGVLYFSMAYLLLGALFLTVGAMASTVREVQTLSMPVTMMQLMVFFLAAYAIALPGSALETFAIAFPLSSPFAMLARAALEESLWTHAIALGWQAVWVFVLVKGGSMLFRKRVMKSGGAGHEKRRRRWLGRRKTQQALTEPAE
ncbi:ABC transporter permease [Erythrobacter sp. THAF29]|uniref:ABC transporter permease n=1 Tax=Erythrobacter sp. THAF29 TaxID=2587851 RepID=UPI00126951BD|nr:ABC transporter permease [Erythrobacter sp. THAF29]QFT76498.1 ABC-2 family transporter protein [Erythrobacter sp. THAF29]